MTTIPGESTQVFHFSSGNPSVKETRGVMHLYRDDFASPTSELPVGRKTLVCVLGVPNHITYADFCQFCSSSIQHMLEMRIVRNDGMQDKYSVFIRFDNQSSTDAFYERFNGEHFSPLEVEACHVLFTFDVQYTGSIEHAQSTPASSTEQPSCPVCLKRLDQDTSGVFTTICNHSFHCSCISKWTDSSCPVCQYCQQQPEKSICFVCQTSENLWSCVICGFVGCGREGHAITHWKDTQHSYSLELDTQRVWDYVGDDYAHPLIESKTDVDPGFSEALLNSQVETIVNEYRELLTTQLENQKIYFETLISKMNEETEREISEAVEKAVGSQKFQNMQDKLNRYVKEKGFLDKVNENLLKNLEILMAKDKEIKAREKKDLKEKDNKIQKLEEQLGQLMVCLETGDAD